MSAPHPVPPFSKESSLQLPALSTASDGTTEAFNADMQLSTDEPESLDGRFSFVDSDRRSITSYASSADREFIIKDVHGRYLNSRSDVLLIPSFLFLRSLPSAFFQLYLMPGKRPRFGTRMMCYKAQCVADVDEHGRLDIQHEMLKIKLGGLCWPLHHVRRILAPRPEGAEAPAVMDIGTGSGELRAH